MIKKLILVFSLLFITGCSPSTQIDLPPPPSGLVIISSSNDANTSYYESSVFSGKSKYGHFIDFWILQNKIILVDKKPTESSKKTQIRIECTRKKIMIQRTLEYTKFNGAGDLQRDSGQDYSAILEDIVPHTIGESIYEHMCKEYKFVPIQK
jgi:hypothetical protein